MWSEVSEKFANIFDPIQESLDQRVYRGEFPRPSIATFIRRIFHSTLRDTLVNDPDIYFDLFITGSLTTYQYDATSDCDVSVFPDYKDLSKLLEEDSFGDLRRELISIVTTELDGTYLPGTRHPLQFFVMPPGATPEERFLQGGKAAWDLQNNKWFSPPDHSRSHDVSQEMPDLYERAEAIADKMETLLDNKDYDGAREMFAQIHKKRNIDEDAGLGDYPEGNIVYKWMLHEGLFDRLKQEAQVKIAKVAAEEKDTDEARDVKVIYNFERDSITLGTTAAEDDLPRGDIVLGSYDGKDVHLHNVAKQWINANYFKKLWAYSFPTRPINKIYFDHTEIPTRPLDQMTYTQKLPHLTANLKWQETTFLYSPSQGLIEDPYNTHSSLLQKAYPSGVPNEDIVMGRVYSDAGRYFVDFYTVDQKQYQSKTLEAEALEVLRGKYPNITMMQKSASDPWRKGKDWKDFIKNDGIIVDFQFGDPKDDPVEGKVIHIDSNGIKIKLKSGDTRVIPKDLLHDIKFRVRDEKRSISHVASVSEDPLRTLYHHADCAYVLRDNDLEWIKLAKNWWSCPGCQKTSWWDHDHDWMFRWGWNINHGLIVEDQQYYNNTHSDMAREIYGENVWEDELYEQEPSFFGYGELNTTTGVLTVGNYSYDYGRTGEPPSQIFDDIKRHFQSKGFLVKEVVPGKVMPG